MPATAATTGGRIRPAAASDFEAILHLNQQWESVTSRLDTDTLAQLHGCARYHRVLEKQARVVAFLLALGPGQDYDSPNYRWFDSRADDFLYIDRIIVDGAHQRAGLGDALYNDLLAFAQDRRIARLVCEVDIEPLNQASDRFHARRGFVEVGTQRVAGGSRRVSLRERALG